MNNKVYVVGGDGYIGTRLCRLLREEGWDVKSIDMGVYKNIPVTDKQDVLELEPAGDGAPVLWLATIHREPAGFLQMPEADQRKWVQAMERLMVDAPGDWIRAGHPLIYPSSMQVVSPMGSSAYGWAKRLFEARWVGTVGVQILRFGTVWGWLDEEPARVETAINSALLGKRLTEDYVAYTSHIGRVLEALAYALCRNYLGTVENVTDSEDPVTGPKVNSILTVPAQKRTVWEHLFMKERVRAESLAKRLKKAKKKREHFTYALATAYQLPWPADLDTTYDIRQPLVSSRAARRPADLGGAAGGDVVRAEDDSGEPGVGADEGAGEPGARVGGQDPAPAGHNDEAPAPEELT